MLPRLSRRSFDDLVRALADDGFLSVLQMDDRAVLIMPLLVGIPYILHWNLMHVA